MGISTNPKNFVEGMFDDMVVTVQKASFGMHNFSRAGEPEILRPAFIMDALPDDSKDGKTFKQAWGCGDTKDFAPSKDGNELLAVGTKTNLSGQCNFALLCRSMLEAGVPEDLVEGLGSDASSLNGAKLHLVKQQYNRVIRGEKVTTPVLLVDSVVALPGEGGTASQVAKAAKGKKGAKARDIEAETTVILLAIMKDSGGSIAHKKVAAQVFGKTQDQDIMSTAFDPEFIGGKDRPWTFEKGTLTAKE